MSGEKIIYDHLGNQYPSFIAMARAYGQCVSTIKNRLLRGWTLEQALTIQAVDTSVKVNPKKDFAYDHTGMQFLSVAAMCEHWGINKAVYYGRLKMGWPLKDILTKPLDYTGGAEHVFDHTGRDFESEKDMCKYWGVKRTTYRQRRQRGWSIERALTENIGRIVSPKERLGTEKYSNCGLKMKIVALDGVAINRQNKKEFNIYLLIGKKTPTQFLS